MTALRTGQVLLMLAGLIAWALQFLLIYGATSTLCGREWADATFLGLGVVQASILIATVTALAATAAAFAWSLRGYRSAEARPVSAADRFMVQSAALVNGFSLIVILWQGIPAFILPACA
ncbi:hypothetical protein [Microvirga zambiensis]|uniref:hypothetical protein n=1 Tax=Microvirga zambiensis TaxID=1402137 RepID=UPI00191EB160|nr:hypothetical protein [Microvirga zambiensis]